MTINRVGRFGADPNNNLVISFNYEDVSVEMSLEEFNIDEIAELIGRFGIDSYEFTNDIYYLSREKLNMVYKAIIKAYSTH